MFKPEYILDNVTTFGHLETIKIIAAKLQRMGRSRATAYLMARTMIQATLNTI
jgi:hypothetical protein